MVLEKASIDDWERENSDNIVTPVPKEAFSLQAPFGPDEASEVAYRDRLKSMLQVYRSLSLLFLITSAST